MNIMISEKNYKSSQRLEDLIRKKLAKLDKYFSEDIDAKVVLFHEGGRGKIEININAGGAFFRTEQQSENIYEAVDVAVDKLARQIRKFKGKLQSKYQDNKSIRFESIPALPESEAAIGRMVKTKSLALVPMTEEDALLKMEMSEHDFYIFLSARTDRVSVVYKRKDGNYGLLETNY